MGKSLQKDIIVQEPRNFYAVLRLEKAHRLQVGTLQTTLKLQWADGMVGAMPVFDSAESAIKYNGGKAEGIIVLALDKSPQNEVTSKGTDGVQERESPGRGSQRRCGTVGDNKKKGSKK